MNQDRVQRVAYRRPLGLGIKYDVGGHVQLGAPVDVGVADADPAGYRRHGGVFGYKPDQAVSAPGNQQVDMVLHSQHGIHQGPVRVIHELDGILRHPGIADSLTHQFSQGGVRAQALFSSPQQAGVARFQTKRRDVYRDVGATLVDTADHAQGNSFFANLQTVGHGSHIHSFGYWVGKRSHAAYLGSRSQKPFPGQQEPVQHGFT